ncbi:MAG: response regulator transcription factor [Gemmatimonadota bacterium]
MAGRQGEAEARRILVVEDEADIAALVAYQLTRAGFQVQTVSSGTDALKAVERQVPHLIVLDIMLTGLSGLEVLERLRSDPATHDVPVLLLTALREPSDRIRGLELGADDYLTKPFSPKELVLRVEAVLRRAVGAAAGSGSMLRALDLRLDPSAARCWWREQELQLTPTEFRLLQALMERRGRTLSRHQLLESVWDVDQRVAGRLQTRTVDMHMRRLRAKLGEAGEWVQTVRGFGYRFEPPDSE